MLDWFAIRLELSPTWRSIRKELQARMVANGYLSLESASLIN